MSGDELWGLTPAQYNALMDRHMNRLSIEDFFTARIQFLLAEYLRDKQRNPDPFKIDNFMIFKLPGTPRAKVPEKGDWKDQKMRWMKYTERRKMVRGR